MLMAWLGDALEELKQVLQVLDEAGKGLYDAVVEDSRNPFYRCKKTLAELCQLGMYGNLKPLFDALPQAVREELPYERIPAECFTNTFDCVADPENRCCDFQ